MYTDVSTHSFYEQLLQPRGFAEQVAMPDRKCSRRTSKHSYRSSDAKKCPSSVLSLDAIGIELFKCSRDVTLSRLIGRTGSGKTSRGPLALLGELLRSQPDEQHGFVILFDQKEPQNGLYNEVYAKNKHVESPIFIWNGEEKTMTPFSSYMGICSPQSHFNRILAAESLSD